MTKGLTAHKKGITPIVAIIILLLITIALAGAAYSYISTYWESVTSKNIQITNKFCTGGNTANIIIKNMGTSQVTLADIVVMNTITGTPVSGDWTTIDGTQSLDTLDQGETGKFNATCTGYCTYRFIYGGAIGASAHTVSVAC